MKYSEDFVKQTLMEFYSFSENTAQKIIVKSKSKNKYEELCELIELKIYASSKQELYDIYFR